MRTLVAAILPGPWRRTSGAHVDDSFVQPQPGTSAGDHLVSGLVPLALLALAAARYPHMRGTSRALTAICAGLFGVMAASEAAYYASAVGVSGDDYSGLLCIPAALCLLGLGLVSLWMTRKRDASLPGTILRRTAIGIAALSGALFVAQPVGFSYVTTHAAGVPVDRIDLGPAAGDGGRVLDERRPHAARVLRAVAKRRGGHRRVRAQEHPAPGADARAPRLRGADLRPSRRGPERRRPQCARMERRRAGHRCSD